MLTFVPMASKTSDSPVNKTSDSPVKILLDLNHREKTSTTINNKLVNKTNSNNTALTMIDLDILQISSSIIIERFDSEDRSDLESSFETSFENDRKEEIDKKPIIDKKEILSLLSFSSADNDTSVIADVFDLHNVDVMDFDDEDKSDLLETSIDHTKS